MMKIALTGNIASGKSTIEKIFIEKGFVVLDVDKISHNLMSDDDDVINLIMQVFVGFDIADKSKISREKLGRIIFSNAEMKKKLESILHPRIIEKINKFFEENKNEKIVFVSIPLLFEIGIEKLFDKCILVYTDDQIRLERLIKREGYDEEYAKKRLESQMSQDEKKSKCGYVLYNNGNVDELNVQVENLIHTF